LHLQIGEFNPRGHHLIHVRRLIDAVSPYVDKITVSLSSDAPLMPEYKTQLLPIANKVECDFDNRNMEPTGNYLMYGISYAHAVKAAIEKVSPDYYWMPTADIVAQAMSLTLLWGEQMIPDKMKAECIIHRCSPAYPSDSAARFIKSRLVTELLKRSTWTRMHVVDHIAYEWMLDTGGFRSRVYFLPDPIDEIKPISKQVARRRLSLPDGGRYIGIVGAIDGRKGVDRLIEGFKHARLSNDDRLLIVGAATPEVGKVISREKKSAPLRDRIIWVNRFVSDEELSLSLSAMDVVCTPYVGHIGISNILLRAQSAQRPVLGCDTGWQGEIIPRLGLGWTCDPTVVNELAKAIEFCLDSAERYEFTDGARRLVKFHSLDNYSAWVTQGIRSENDLNDNATYLDWGWVVGNTI
jgi:glycosyltransferase involved in cell wall biosynthesis